MSCVELVKVFYFQLSFLLLNNYLSSSLLMFLMLEAFLLNNNLLLSSIRICEQLSLTCSVDNEQLSFLLNNNLLLILIVIKFARP